METTTDLRIKTGRIIQGIRNDKNLSIYAVSKLTGLSSDQVKSIEAGTKSYTIDSYIAICKAIGFDGQVFRNKPE